VVDAEKAFDAVRQILGGNLEAEQIQDRNDVLAALCTAGVLAAGQGVVPIATPDQFTGEQTPSELGDRVPCSVRMSSADPGRRARTSPPGKDGRAVRDAVDDCTRARGMRVCHRA